MCREKKVALWLSLISGVFILTATAEELPPPIEKEYPANSVADEQVELAGKIVKVKFNRIYSVKKIKDGLYTGFLYSSVKPQGDSYYNGTGIRIQFAQEGLGCFLKFIPKLGAAAEESIAIMSASDSGKAYIRVSSDAKAGSLVVGDQYKKDGDKGVYKWSEETEVPDLETKRKLSVSDVVLFPDQLNGKTIELQFYDAGQIKQKSAEEFSANISCGYGHASVPIQFPAAGKTFFKEIAGQMSESKAYSVYAVVTLSPNGMISLEAKGRRASGSEYRW